MTDTRLHASTFLSWNRRDFLRGLMVAGGAGLMGLKPESAAAEPPPETNSIRIIFDPALPALCYGPQYVAKELLAVEGFTEIRYVKYGPDFSDAKVIADGEADMTAAWAGDFVVQAEDQDSLVMLSGMHVGCTEVFGSERVGQFRDLKGKRIAVDALGSVEHTFFSSMIAYIGIDPHSDVNWVVLPYLDWGQALTDGEVDAILLWPPDAQIFREKKIGHVILNTTTDKPWNQYFCCMVAANREFVQKYPVATKRALRAMLKATDLCALQPQLAAQAVVDQGLPFDYDRAVQAFSEVPSGRWREFDPEDTLRFYSLRMRQIGLIEKSPDALLADSTDWRFLNELKRELKT